MNRSNSSRWGRLVSLPKTPDLVAWTSLCARLSPPHLHVVRHDGTTTEPLLWLADGQDGAALSDHARFLNRADHPGAPTWHSAETLTRR